jgi:hypothetical protein
MKAAYLFEGCGAAILILLAYIWPQISPAHVAIYLSALPTTSVTAGILIDLVALSLVWAAMVALISRIDGHNGRMIWTVILGIVTSAAVASIAKLTETQKYLPRPGVVGLCILIAGLIAWHFQPRMYRTWVRGFRSGLQLVGLCIFWMLPQLLFITLHRQQTDVVSFRHPVTSKISVGSKRIVWILFDELSYAQTFEGESRNLSLPNFHLLRDESVSFSQLAPPGYYTARVVPALLTGRRVDDLRGTLDGQALVRSSDRPGWQSLDPQQTIFADAHRDGWTTGIAGWSNPYCRLFSSVVDSCYWFPDQFTPSYLYSHMSPRKSALQNAIAPIRSVIRRLRHHRSEDPSSTEYHLRDATELLAPAEALIRDEQLGFVFIHMPVPHPPGVYDRHTQQPRNGGSYLDNLALADRELGELMSAIKSTRLAASTTLIICSDHSWRIPMWRKSASWTEEDEQASKKGIDTRPVLLVHFPHQKRGIAITQPRSSLVMHSLLEEIIHGNVSDESGLVSKF